MSIPQISPINWIWIILCFLLIMIIVKMTLPEYYTQTLASKKTSVKPSHKKLTW